MKKDTKKNDKSMLQFLLIISILRSGLKKENYLFYMNLL
jgi:hypothetical protein